MANQIITTIPGKLHNISPSMLADLIGELDRKAKDAENELKAAKDVLKARNIVAATGDHFTVQLESQVRASLDTTAIRTEMGTEWCDDRSKLAEVVTVRIATVKATSIVA